MLKDMLVQVSIPNTVIGTQKWLRPLGLATREHWCPHCFCLLFGIDTRTLGRAVACIRTGDVNPEHGLSGFRHNGTRTTRFVAAMNELANESAQYLPNKAGRVLHFTSWAQTREVQRNMWINFKSFSFTLSLLQLLGTCGTHGGVHQRENIPPCSERPISQRCRYPETCDHG